MTVELGNINKGIPMGSYTPGEGGGGATKVTGVDPIAVTNGSVAIKIDEQTLQVNEQGELSANLDEIGSELSDLSGRVTAAEADILAKENKITAIAPITLKEEVKSNLKGMVYTTDGTGVYNPTGKGFYDEPHFNTQSDGVRIYVQQSSEFFVKASDISPLGGIMLPSYISIPYMINQIVQTPNTDIFGYGYYCKTLTDGSVVPIASVNSGIDNIGVSDTCSLTDYNRNICIGAARGVSSPGTTVGESSWTHGCYAQLKDDGNTITQYYQLYPNSVYKKTISDTADINRLKEIDCVVFTPMFSERDTKIKFGIDASTAFPVNQIGLYEGNLADMLTAETEPAISATNLFNLGGVSSKNYLELSVGSGLAITDGKLTATGGGSSAPENMVTTDTDQSITGLKTFTQPLYVGSDTYLGDKQLNLKNLSIGASDTRDINIFTYQNLSLVGSNLFYRDPNSAGGSPILHTANLGNYVDGTTITYANNKLSAVGGGASDPEKHGLEGDYCSRYGIVDCPNGILEEGTGQVTLKAGVVMQMTETDGLTTNASDMPHDITSTVDFDLFYTSGSLLEATQVVFSKQEPEDGATGVLAWYNGTQWQFKSNDAGNVWKSAPAARLAHIHITDGNITRIDYIGNRHLNKVIPVTTDTEQTITGQKTFTDDLFFDCTKSTYGSLGLRAKYMSGSQVKTAIVFGGQLGTNNNLQFGLEDAQMTISGKSIQFRGGIPSTLNNGTILTQSTVTGTDNVTVTETADGIQVAGLSNSAIAALAGMTNNMTIHNNVVSGTEYVTTEAGYWIASGNTVGPGYISIDLKDSAGGWPLISGINSPTTGWFLAAANCFVAAGETIRVRHGNLDSLTLRFYKSKGGV